jgi:hypothetical protein
MMHVVQWLYLFYLPRVKDVNELLANSGAITDNCALSLNTKNNNKEAIKHVALLTARCKGLTGLLLSMSPSALKDISRSFVGDRHGKQRYHCTAATIKRK